MDPIKPEPPQLVSSVSQVQLHRTYATFNYKLFRPHSRNREVFDEAGKAKNQDLLKSMSRRGFLPGHAIEVVLEPGASDLMIMEGHNRAQIAELLNLPVWFKVSAAEHCLDPLEGSSIQQPWTLQDKVFSYQKDLPDYREIHEYQVRTGIPLGVVANLFRGEFGTNSNFVSTLKAGKYVIRNRVLPAKIEAILVRLSKQVPEAAGFIRSRNFVSALSKVYLYSEAAFDELLVRMSRHPHKLSRQVTVDAYLSNLEVIFNFNRSDKQAFLDPLRQALRERKRNFGKSSSS